MPPCSRYPERIPGSGGPSPSVTAVDDEKGMTTKATKKVAMSVTGFSALLDRVNNSFVAT